MASHAKHKLTIQNYGSDEDTSTDGDDYYEYDDDSIEESAFHPLLEDDMERVKKRYGSEAINYRLYSAVDSVDVELSFQTQVLEREIAVAWKIKPDEPITVRIHLSVSHYLDGEIPKIEVFQPSQREKFGIGSQMRKILDSFLSEEWNNLSNASVQAKLKGSAVSSTSTSQPHSESTLNYDCSQLAVEDHTEAFARVMEMGFSREMAHNALVQCRFDVLDAINLLVTDPECCLDKTATVSDQQAKHVKSSIMERNPLGSLLSEISRKFDSRTLVSVQDDPKKCPDLSEGFLVMIMQYVYQRLPTLNEFCVVCDKRHVIGRGMLKPAVCARELCTFSFLSLGVMSDAADDIATEAEVVNLLIVFANAACQSSKQNDIFEPYPTVVNPQKPEELALSPEKKNFQQVKKILDKFPPISEMMHLRESELKKTMDKRDILAYPLLQWIISSNRSHIVKLPTDKQLDFMQTPHQFLLRSSPPAREAIFRKEKAKHGSIFAFHGSPLENWHSILRQGLINASGTKYQRHGAAYGKGIYLSPQASVSFGYSGMSRVLPSPNAVSRVPQHSRRGLPRSKHFLKNTDLTCIALCEVISSPSLRKNGNIWVMPEPNHVCTRFFFVYENGQTSDVSIDTTNSTYSSMIEKAVQYQHQ